MVSKSAPKGPTVYIVDPLVKCCKALWGSYSYSNPVWQLHIQVIVTCKFTTDLTEVVFMSLCCPQDRNLFSWFRQIYMTVLGVPFIHQ